MKYRIEMSEAAFRDVEKTYLHFKSESGETIANKWFRGLVAATESLRSFPNRCPIAPEARLFFLEIRQLLYGKGKSQQRILFGISTDEETEEVVITIYRIRNAMQRYLQDLEMFGEQDDE